MRQIARWMWIVLAINSALTGCTSVVSSNKQSTATAQAYRIIGLATQMGKSAQATLIAENEQATATAQARTILLKDGQSWPQQLSDPFNGNVYGWTTGDENNPELAQIQWSIEGGKYRWQAQAVSGFVWWVVPEQEAVSDFYLVVTAHQVNHPEAGEYGLIFRQVDENNYYLFEINEQGECALFIYSPNGWEVLIDWASQPAVTPGKENRLAVLAHQDVFDFYINDRFIAEYRDERLPSGKTGLLIGLSNPGDEAKWEFDDFELRAPSR